MATTYSLPQPASYFITRAFRIMRKLAAGETPTTDETADALQTFQDMLRSWESDGVNLWRTVNHSETLVAGQQKYKIGAAPSRALSIEECRVRSTVTNDVPMQEITADTYKNFPDKTVTGTPSQYWLSRGPAVFDNTAPTPAPAVDDSWLYIWTTASAELVALGATLEMTLHVPFQVPQVAADVIDVPQEWYGAVSYNLASWLADEYGAAEPATIAARAAALYDTVKDFDRPDFLYITPENPWPH